MSRVFDTRYYYLTKLFCSVVGLWPYQTENQRRAIQSFNFLVIASYVPPQLKRLHQIWGKDIDAVCMCMPPIFIIFVYLSKSLTLMFFKPEIKVLLRQIQTEWKRTLNEREKNILKIYALRSRTLCIAYAVLIYNGLVCFIAAPMISPILDFVLPRNETRVRGLGFDLDYGIDMQTYWFWLWLHTSAAGIVIILSIVGSSVIYIMLTIHVCYFFAKTRDKLEHITDLIRLHTAQFLEDKNYNTHDVHQREELRLKFKEQAAIVKECIRSHEKAIKNAQVLRNIYMWSLFVEVSVMLILISISAVQLVSKMFRWAEMTMSGTYVVSEIMHLFFLSLVAQFISDQSLNIHETAYSSAWYNLSTKFQKNFVLILMRSKTPCQLTVGNMFVLSLETFCTILQTSMSYFTILASFR